MTKKKLVGIYLEPLLAKKIKRLCVEKEVKVSNFVEGVLAGFISNSENLLSLNNALSPIQIKILGLIVQGLSYRKIGEQLYLSEPAIKIHTNKICRVLHVKNKVELAAYAGKVGLYQQVG